MNTDGPIKKILTFLDGTEESVTAAQYAILLAQTTGAEISAVYVINTRALRDLVSSRIFLEDEQTEYQRDLESDADRYLAHIQELASDKNVSLESLKVSGEINKVLKDLIDDQGFDLLVIGELARVRSRRDEFYDETERAMRRVKCSVLIVKDPDRVYDLFEGPDAL